MKIAIVSLMALSIAGLGITTSTPEEGAMLSQEQAATQATAQADADILYALVEQARKDLRELRIIAGLDPVTGAPVLKQEPMSSAERARQARRVEAGAEGGEEGEEGGWIARGERSDETYRNGARMVIAYNEATQSFTGTVRNTTRESLSDVRVEVHLSDGTELGPTKRTDLAPGATLDVELSALGNQFTHWVTHPEAGQEAGHGSEGGEGGEEGGEEGEGHEEGRERGGEHGREGREGGGEEGEGHEEGGEGEEGGESAGMRPRAGSLRPVYNELQLLLTEIRVLSAQIEARR